MKRRKDQACYCGVDFIKDTPDPKHHTIRTCSKCGNRWIMSMTETLGDNHWKKDPFKAIPVGWRCPVNQYTVMAFCSSKRLFSMMAMVRYDNEPPSIVCSTTRDYLTVCEDYKKWMNTLSVCERLLALGHSKTLVKKMFPKELDIPRQSC